MISSISPIHSDGKLRPHVWQTSEAKKPFARLLVSLIYTYWSAEMCFFMRLIDRVEGPLQSLITTLRVCFSKLFVAKW